MSKHLKRRWIAVILIWVLVTGLTGWNIHRIGRIQTDRGNLAILRMDLQFLKANRTTIMDVRSQKARLNHLAESRDFGFLVVENNLKRLSTEFGLLDFSVKTDESNISIQEFTIKTAAFGPVPAVAEWVCAVEKAYPYLEIDQLEYVAKPDSPTGTVQVRFNYHLILSNEGPVS